MKRPALISIILISEWHICDICVGLQILISNMHITLYQTHATMQQFILIHLCI